jgi:hypothetical protein
MRAAEMIPCKPFGYNDIKSGFRRFAGQHGSLKAGIFLGRLPFDLVRELKDHAAGLSSTARADEQITIIDRIKSAREQRSVSDMASSSYSRVTVFRYNPWIYSTSTPPRRVLRERPLAGQGYPASRPHENTRSYSNLGGPYEVSSAS